MRYFRSARGFTLVEVLFVTGLVAVVGSIGVVSVQSAVDEFQTLGAVRYLVARLQQTRMEAVSRNADAAVRFVQAGESFTYAVYLDGNRNGVRSADIALSIDTEIHPTEELSDKFAGVRFGALPGLPAIAAGGTPPGSDPIRVGSSNMLTFSPRGTSTPGSLYLYGPSGAQYAVRVFGETGKVRILRFDRVRRVWTAL